MELYEEISYHLEHVAIDNEESILGILSDYIDRAPNEVKVFQALELISQDLVDQGRIHHGLELAINLYQINGHDHLAYLIAKFYQQYLLSNQALEWIHKIPSEKRDYNCQLLLADILISLNQVNEAREILTNLIQDYPVQVEAYHQLADLYDSHDMIESAQKYYQLIFDYFLEESDRRRSRLKLLELALKQEIIDQQLIDQLIQVKDLPLESRDELQLASYAYLWVNELTKAKQLASQLLDLDKDSFDAHFILLQIAIEESNNQEAQDQIDWLCLSLPPYSQEIMEVARCGLAINYLPDLLLERLGQLLDLLDDFDSYYEVLSLLVNHYLDEEQPNKALELLSQASKELEDDQIYLSYLFGKAYQDEGQLEEAALAFKQALDLQVNEANLFNSYYQVLCDLGQVEEAEILRRDWMGNRLRVDEGDDHDYGG
ncbi:hypothetical protein ACWOBE_03620 [Hutsoniella sourekii]